MKLGEHAPHSLMVVALIVAASGPGFIVGLLFGMYFDRQSRRLVSWAGRRCRAARQEGVE